MISTSPLDIPDTGFKTLNFHFPKERALKVYRLFDSVCDSFEKDYEHYFSELDQLIDQFIVQCDMPIANQTLKLKHIKSDGLKYKSRTSNEYDIYSYQYFPGLYDYIQQRISLKNQFLDFFKEVDQCHALIREQMQPIIEQIEMKMKTTTVLKIWKHSPLSHNPFFLPLHCDRSIFTAIIHTENSGEECLRIYPPSAGLHFESMLEKPTPKIPKKRDFPLMFPGIHAKSCFSLDPTPHCVVSNPGIKNRRSLIFFIARFEGW